MPTAADLELLLVLYGKEDHIPFMRELLSAAHKARNWWAAMSDAVPKWFNLFLGLESGATELYSFDTVVVPGLLQTPEYATAVLRGNPNLNEEQVRQPTKLRRIGALFGIRDSKNVGGPVLTLDEPPGRAFLAAVRRFS